MGEGKEQRSLWYSQSNNVHLYSLLFLFLSSFPPTHTEAATTSALPGAFWKTPLIIGNNATAPDPILIAGGPGPSFAFGFFRRPSHGFLLAIYLVLTDDNSSIVPTTPVEVVWTANRNNPIKEYGELHLTADGNLRLSDARNNLMWSTNTSERGAASLILTVKGNLALLDPTGQVVWQSYSYPTDTALRDQNLTGMTLVANVSATNSSEGSFYLSITDSSYEAYIINHGSPAQMYYRSESNTHKKIQDGKLFPLPDPCRIERSCEIVEPSTSIQGNKTDPSIQKNQTDSSSLQNQTDTSIQRNHTVSTSMLNQTNSSTGPLTQRNQTDPASFAKGFVRLEADGHLREYVWRPEFAVWQPTEASLIDYDLGVCGYPMACGEYGICYSDNNCHCPKEDETGFSYFQEIDESKPKQGCRLRKGLLPSCAAHGSGMRQSMLHYQNISYFGYVHEADLMSVDGESCKQVCDRNCSCRAAFLKYGLNKSAGDCYLISAVLSMRYDTGQDTGHYNSLAYIKVQLPDAQRHRKKFLLALIVSIVGSLTLAGTCFGYVLHYRRKKRQRENGDRFFQFEHLPGMPTRFKYKELKKATNGFTTKLGEGGFGAVFKGTLGDGTQVAVKILGYRGQGLKEFVAEVETIGSIHHLNLVRLVGYCAERLHRLLVYEYLSNGSLDYWIFHDEANRNTDNKPLLDWDTKMKILLQVAKGLCYLHDECRQKIIHLDIKPQNILLDDDFNAKVSDFGLSKLVERDQSQVVTTMRGTPGYIAPEWLNSVITEKVDVYSFGVLVLETVSGKRILDYSRSQGSIYLLKLLSKAVVEDRIADIIGDGNDGPEAMRLVKIAMSCLQMDYTNRPTMSAVVKAINGDFEVEPAVDFWIPTSGMTSPPAASSSTMSVPMMSSIVYGGR